MSQSQSVLVSTLACSTLLLTGALGQQDAAPARIPQSLFKSQGTPTAARALLEELSRKQVDWLSTTVWQKMWDGENSFEATGALHRGPANRFRLDMTIQSAQPSHLLIVSDGKTLRQSHRVGAGAPAVRAWSLAGDNAPGSDASCIDEGRCLVNLAALLKRLRDGLQEATVQPGLWQDVPVLRIAGTWMPRDDTPADLRPPLRPRICHLYLDATTHWPLRIEWWGAEHPQGTPALLLQMEFRDLKVNQPPSAEESARLFSFSPAAK